MAVLPSNVAALLSALALAALALASADDKEIEFLTSNKEKDGVVTLPSGLQYKVLRKGAGGFHPKVNSPCECHYKCASPTCPPPPSLSIPDLIAVLPIVI
jgi:hypothetical protein